MKKAWPFFLLLSSFYATGQSLNCSPPYSPFPIPQARLTEDHEEVKVYSYLIVPNDLPFVLEEADSVIRAMKDIQAWYQIQTGGMTFDLAYPDSVIVYRCKQAKEFYQSDWWGTLLPEMSGLGHPIWQKGYIMALWIKGTAGQGVGLGAQWCDGYCGVGMAAVEGWPKFNPGTYSTPCPLNSNSAGSEWPCVPRGTMGHELGHAFGLPHSDDPNSGYFPQTEPVKYHSIMAAHWNFPYTPRGHVDDPWGLLSKEIQKLYVNPAFRTGVSLIQAYPNAPLVNLPKLIPVPNAQFSYKVKNDSVYFNNTSTGATVNYWIFSDSTVSNELHPVRYFTYNLLKLTQLRVCNDSGMISKYMVPDIITSINKNHDQQIGDWGKTYPNPNQGLFHLLLPEDQVVKVEIMDAFGKTVREVICKGREKVDISEQPTGVYWARIKSGDQLFTGVLYKQ